MREDERPLKTSEIYMQIKNALDFQVRFADMAKTHNCSIDVEDARFLLALVEVAIDLIKKKEKEDEQREITDKRYQK